MGIKLYEHNRAAYESVLTMLRETGKAAVIHPTGTGKSFIGFKLCEDNPDKTVCWLSPSEYIYKTQLENLKASGGEEPKNIKFFTYAKLMNMNGEELAEIKPEIIVSDEFHRAGADRWQIGVENLLQLYPDVPVLGLSATNIRYLDNQRDMAEELFDGNVASEMTLGESIVRGILNPPRYVLSVFSYQKDLEKYERRVKAAKGKAVRDAAEKYLEALRRALEKADGLDVVFDRHMTDRTGKYIVFCANKEHMDDMIERSREWFAKVDANPYIYSVYSIDPNASKSFDDFRADNDDTHLRLLFCIDALNEGIHIDGVKGVILLRPTVSPIIYKQQIGRALSANKTKDTVIFDIVMNIENLYSIGEIEDEMQLAAAYYRDLGEPEQIVNERFRIIDEVHDCIELFERLNETLSASWDIMYGYAKAYYRENGNLEISSRYRTEDGYSLGRWIFNQRNIRNGAVAGSLTEEQIKKLDRIGMVWESVLDLRWDRNFEAARLYYEENGNLNVPARYVTADGIALGAWLAALRRWGKAHLHSNYLTEERKRRLDGIGMVWDMLDYCWERNYHAAYEYFIEHRDLNVPSKYVTKDGIRLGIWISSQRKLRSGAVKRGTPPTPEQVKRLDAIGMKWVSRVEQRWDKAYETAKEYSEKNGGLIVPVNYTAKNGVKLGLWIQNQRKSFSFGKLSDIRKRRLDEIGMVWETADPWLMRYEAVKKYYDENGTIRIPLTYVMDNFWIGKWIVQQKKAYDDGTLTEERRKLMERLPLYELEYESRWEKVCADLKSYLEKNGDLNVPTDYCGESGTNLKVWMITQRRKKRLGKLSSEQIEALDSLGFSWEPRKGWENGYRHAKEYYDEHGDLDMPNKYVCADGFKLGAWISARRAEYNGRSAELTAERARELSKIGMVWKNKSNWDRRYDRAKEYVRVHGCLPKKETAVTEEEKAVAIWLGSQRVCFFQGRLTEEHIEKLKKLAPEIVADVKLPFEVGYANALEYYRANGDLNVPAGYRSENGFWLGAWIKSRRKNRSKLSEKQVSRLDEIGMIWEDKGKWETQFEKAERYYAGHGYFLNEPKLCQSQVEKNLYQWIRKQRKLAKDGELSEERIRKLTEIGMDWRGAKERAWERGYDRAAEYYAKNGNLNVPVSYVCEDGYPLGEWLHTQRKPSNGKEEQRLKKLALIGVVNA